MRLAGLADLRAANKSGVDLQDVYTRGNDVTQEGGCGGGLHAKDSSDSCSAGRLHSPSTLIETRGGGGEGGGEVVGGGWGEGVDLVRLKPLVSVVIPSYNRSRGFFSFLFPSLCCCEMGDDSLTGNANGYNGYPQR